MSTYERSIGGQDQDMMSPRGDIVLGMSTNPQVGTWTTAICILNCSSLHPFPPSRTVRPILLVLLTYLAVKLHAESHGIP